MTTIEFATIKKYGDIINNLFDVDYRIFDRDQMEASTKYLCYHCPKCQVSPNECYETHLSCTLQVERELGCFQYMCPNGYSFIVIDFYVRSVSIGCMILGPMQVSYNNNESLPTSVPALRSKQYNNLQNLLRELVALYNTSSYSTSTDLSVDVLPSVSFRPLIKGYTQYNLDLENQLVRMVSNGFIGQAVYVISQIIDNLFDVTGQDASEIRKRVEELAYLIAHCSLSDSGVRPEVFRESNKYHSEIKKLKSKEDFIAFLSDVVDFHCNLLQKSSASDDRSNVIIKRAHDFISQHFAEKLTLDQTASYCRISPSYLGSILTNKLGFTFTQYVNLIRIEHSKELLSSTDLSIGCIAEKCGFSGQSYFTQVFKSFVGRNPVDFRKEIKNKED